jgi:serine/threonine-protein kinase
MGLSLNSSVGLPVKQGQLIAGKYRIDHLVGERGTGVVMAAEHLALRQYVAIKVLRTSATPEHVERFFREARAAASIASDHVVRVMDLDRLDTGEPYIVMELLEGKTLAALLDADGPMPVAQAVDYVMHACEAVGKAHAAGIVHRELKPANLFLTKDERGGPCVKVLDFGICKLAAGDAGGPSGWLTGASALLGSPAHMAPEQWASASDVDARTDVWALGTILYELMAARAAFAGEDLAAICNAVQHHDPVALRSLRVDIPLALESVIMGCLAKRPEFRPATAASLGLAISPWATAVGHAVLDEIGKLTADPSRPEVAGKAVTMVASIRDPRVHSLPAMSAVKEPAVKEIVSAPTVAVHGVTVHDPVIASAPPARTASGTIQLAAQPEASFSSGSGAAVPIITPGAFPAAPTPVPTQGFPSPPSMQLPPTVGMPESRLSPQSPAGMPAPPGLIPPTVRMASVPPAAPRPSPYPASVPPPAPAPTPMAYPAPLPPTVIGPHLAEGRAPVPWLLIVVVALCLLAVVGVTVAWLLSR